MFILPVFIFSSIFSGSPQTLDTSELIIKTADSEIAYEAEVALTDEQKRTGLMYRKQMAENHGMVFYNETPHRMVMWMKNTYIPLDMIFTDKDGEIVCIFENTTPHSLEHLACDEDVALTLELNAGQVNKNGIKLGDKIIHNLLKNTADE